LASLVAACDHDELVSLAVREGVAGAAYEVLGPLLSPPARRRLLAGVRADVASHLARLAMLGEVGHLLDETGVQWVVLKGPLLAELAHQRTPRGYRDLDLLVAAGQFGEAVAVLQRAGYLVAERNWARLTGRFEKELLLAYQGQPAIDLHWHVVSRPEDRRRYRLPVEELLARRQRVELSGVPAWSLDADDLLAHVALHANESGSHRLRCLLDVQRVIANLRPDWAQLVMRCQQWRAGLPVASSLLRAKRLLRAEVPQEVTSELVHGPGQRLLVNYLSSWSPKGKLPAGRSFRNGLARSVRANLVATADAFVKDALQTVADIALHRPSEVVIRAQAGFPRSPAEQDLSGLGAYLAMVTSTDRYGCI